MVKRLKTILAALMMAALVLPTTVLSALTPTNLSEYYSSQNLPFVSCDDRIEIARDLGIMDYNCSAEKNGELLSLLLEDNLFHIPELDNAEENLGASQLPSDFKTTLANDLDEGGTETEIELTSVTTFDGHELTMSDIGPKGYVKICPNCSNREIASFTGINTSTKKLTGVVRGYNFYNTATSTSNIQDHGPGELVIISNDFHYLVDNYVSIADTQTITGPKDFSNVTTTFSGGRACFKGTQCVIDFGTSLGWTDNGIDTFTFASGSSGLVAGDGIDINGSNIDLDIRASRAVTTTSGELDILTKTNGGITQDANGLFTTVSDLTSASITTSTPTASVIPLADSSAKLNRGWFFGGTGADGALSVLAGTTTTVDLGSARIKVLNYTSINIAATGMLTFSNPHASGTFIIIRSQGAVTIAGIVDASGFGSAAGTGGPANGNNGTSGTNSDDFDSVTTHFGAFGTQGGNGSTGALGAGGTLAKATFYTDSAEELFFRTIRLFPGNGGGGGGSGYRTTGNSGAGGNSGRGGAAVLFEVGGAWNFTGTIKANGAAGSNGSNASGGDAAGGGGGGGGAGGHVVVLYNSLTSNVGTIQVSGGNGGNGGNGSNDGSAGTQGGGGGGGGGSTVQTAGGNGGVGQVAANGDSGATPAAGGTGGTGGTGIAGSGGGGGGGGGGAVGTSFVTLNSWIL